MYKLIIKTRLFVSAFMMLSFVACSPRFEPKDITPPASSAGARSDSQHPPSSNEDDYHFSEPEKYSEQKIKIHDGDQATSIDLSDEASQQSLLQMPDSDDEASDAQAQTSDIRLHGIPGNHPQTKTQEQSYRGIPGNHPQTRTKPAYPSTKTNYGRWHNPQGPEETARDSTTTETPSEITTAPQANHYPRSHQPTQQQAPVQVDLPPIAPAPETKPETQTATEPTAPAVTEPAAPVPTTKKSPESFVCKISSIAQEINKGINTDRDAVLNVIEMLKTNSATGDDRKFLIQQMMLYRMIGPVQYNYSAAEHPWDDQQTSDGQTILGIESMLEVAADKMLDQNPNAPEKCSFLVGNKTTSDLITSDTCINEIKERMQIIPAALVAAQAVVESSSGTSRFATDGNNLFGLQVIFKSAAETAQHARCMQPKQSPTRCYVKFETRSAAVKEYYHRINAGASFDFFRDNRRNIDLNASCDQQINVVDGLKGYAEDPNYFSKIKTNMSKVCQAIAACQ